MNLEETIEVQASTEEIWAVITDIKGAEYRLSGIDKVEILYQPESGLVGLKWKETRTMFGKQAEETMWIIEAKAPEFYITEAHNHGMVYKSKMFIRRKEDLSILGMAFQADPQSLGAKIMAALSRLFMKKSMRKMMRRDLNELKAVIE